MSFPRANIKRFNDAKGCAPPVGAYDPKQVQKQGAIVIDKADRFKAPKDVLPGPGSFDITTETCTPVKKLFNESVCSNSSNNGNPTGTSKQKKSEGHSAESAKIKELEREIRRLLSERTNQDKQLVQREDDITKLEGRLHNAQLDKSSLQAKIASLEKEVKETKKSNDVLKNKVTTAESAGKKYEGIQAELVALKQQVDAKEKEIMKLRQELNSSMTTQLTDLDVYKENIICLEEKISELELIQKQFQDEENKENIGKTKSNLAESKTKNEGKFNQLNMSQADVKRRTAEKLHKRFGQAMKEYDIKIRQYRVLMEERYNKAVDQQRKLEETLQQTENKLQDAEKCSEAIQKYRDALVKQNRQLQTKIREIEHENWDQEDRIRFLKGEVSVTADNMMVESQKLFESNAEIAGLSETMDQLEDERNTLNENIKTLTEKYQILETKLAEEQTSSKHHIDKLESQLHVTKDGYLEIQVEFEILQSKNKELIYNLNKEKEEVEHLMFQLSEQEQLNGDLKTVIEDKEEFITDLEIQLEANKVEMQHLKEIASIHAEEVESLQKKIVDVEESLREQLKQEEEIHCQTAREHADRIFDLEHKEFTMSEENKRYQEEKLTLESTCQDLHCKVDELSEKIADIQKNSEIEIQKIKEAKDSEVNALECTLKDLKKEKDESCTTIKEQTEKILDFEDMISKYRKEVASLEMKMEDVEGEFYEKVRFLESEAQKAEKLENEKMELEKEVKEKGKDKENLEEQIKVLESKIANVHTEAKERETDLISDYRQLTKELQEMTESRDTFEQKVCVITEESTRLEAMIQKLETQVQEYQTELETQKSESVISSEKLANMMDTLEKQEKKHQDDAATTNKKIDSLTVENNQLMKEIDYLTAVRQKDKDDNQKDLTNFESRVKQLTEEKSQLTDKIGELNNAKATLDIELVGLKTNFERKVDELLNEKSIFSDKLQSLNEQIDILSNEKNTEQKIAADMQGKIGELQALNEQKVNEISMLQDKLEKVTLDGEARINMLENKIEAITEENSCLADQVGNSEQAKLGLKEEIDNLKSCLQELQEQQECEDRKVTENISKSKEACQKEQEKNQKLEQELSKLQHVLQQTESKCTAYAEKVEKTNRELHSEQQIREAMENEFNKKDMMCSDLENKMKSWKQTIYRLEEENSTLTNTQKHLTEELSSIETENQLLHSKVMDQQSFIEEQNNELEDAIRKHHEEMDRLRMEVKQKSSSKELEDLSAESQKWRKMYEELQAKVQPFMEQLDAFEREKQALEGRSNFAQAEIEKLSAQYAKLLGHQNQKQKIHHIAKIKEENNHLKKEVTILREQCLKQKRSMQKLEDKVTSLEGKRKFDPSKAFSHCKENNGPIKSPLKDGNRN